MHWRRSWTRWRQKEIALGAFGSAFGGLAPAPPSPNWLDSLSTARPAPAPLTAPVKCKAFLSVHFDDIMRVNVVRNAWKITHPDNALMRSFYDSSLWEKKKLEGDEAVKRLIREGVGYTSAVLRAGGIGDLAARMGQI